MKAILLLASLMLAVGCSPSTSDVSAEFQMPYELRDCRLIKLRPGGLSGDTVYVLKCPEGYMGTSASINHGKYSNNNAIIVKEGN